MPSAPTELIPANICSILEHMTEQIAFSTPPALLPNFSAYSSTATLDLDPLIKSRKEEYLFFSLSHCYSISKTLRRLGSGQRYLYEKFVTPTFQNLTKKYENFHCDIELWPSTVVQSYPAFVTFQHRYIKRSVSDQIQYLKNKIYWQRSNFLLRLMPDYQTLRLFIILKVYNSTYASDIRTEE